MMRRKDDDNDDDDDHDGILTTHQGSKGIEGESLAGLSLGASCDLTHNAQHLRSRCLPPKCPWENLPIKKLNAFLADVNTKGQLSLTKKEVSDRVSESGG